MVFSGLSSPAKEEEEDVSFFRSGSLLVSRSLVRFSFSIDFVAIFVHRVVVTARMRVISRKRSWRIRTTTSTTVTFKITATTTTTLIPNVSSSQPRTSVSRR